MSDLGRAYTDDKRHRGITGATPPWNFNYVLQSLVKLKIFQKWDQQNFKQQRIVYFSVALVLVILGKLGGPMKRSSWNSFSLKN